jgi:hypothetical protein
MLAAGAAPAGAACPNEAFRSGPSAGLPDCRAYELVSPPNTGGILPTAANLANTPHAFESSLISPSADTAVFQSTQGALPGTNGTGLTDRYLAIRGPDGWATEPIGPTATQTEQPWPGGITPDHSYYFLHAGGVCGFLGTTDQGSLVQEFGNGEPCDDFIRGPGGSYELIARGSLGEDPRAEGFYIAAGATHVIFDTSRGTPAEDQPIQLEPNAPPTGTVVLYDRSSGGPTHVVSLLPGNVTPAAGEDAFFAGSSADGSTVAFKLGSADSGETKPSLYVRVDNANTYEVTSVADTFAGVSEDGDQVFYANAASSPSALQTPADLFSFDTATQATTQITTVGDAQFVNVSADGSRVYFVSQSQIGGEGIVGQPNLYVWDRAGETTTLVATVVAGDLAGAAYPSSQFPPSLVGWTEFAQTATKESQFGAGANLSRTTPDGSVIVFESAAQLTAYDNAGHQEVYRYRVGDGAPVCVSCGPGVGPATADASLQSFSGGLGDHVHPLNAINLAVNLVDDGGTVFFQSKQTLLPADANGRQDVYEWEADGVRGCGDAGGCTALISTGRATKDSFLYAATTNGSDVLFITPQPLVPQDQNGGTGALYDARVQGGFPQPPGSPAPCQDDACQGSPTPAPSQTFPGSTAFSGHGNRSPGKRCARHHRRPKKGRCAAGKHRHGHRHEHSQGRDR